MKLAYAVVFERTPSNYAAYAPDLPGCISTGRTWEEMQWMIREAITVHLEDARGRRPHSPAANVRGTGP